MSFVRTPSINEKRTTSACKLNGWLQWKAAPCLRSTALSWGVQLVIPGVLLYRMLLYVVVSYATYYTWMAECVSQPARYVDHDRCINPEHLADLMRFRVGSHWLSVVTGRWADGGTVRAQRYCRKCMACIR